MPTLTVRRETAWRDRLRRYRILLDGVEVGQLLPGEVLTLHPEPGPHELRARIDWCGSQPLLVTIGDGAVVVVVRSALRGWRVLFAAATITRRPDHYLVLEQAPAATPR